MRAVLDITDAAYYLHTTVEALRDHVKHKTIPFKKRGDRVIFLFTELNAWLMALPGNSVETSIQTLKTDFDEFTDTHSLTTPEHAPQDTTVEKPLRLKKFGNTGRLLGE